MRPRLGLLLALALAGCRPAVREDRTITFGPDGRASFQHGRNGVFVTDPTTGKPKAVYSPTPDDVATSPPAWDAAGKRMVFAVAQSLDGSRPAPRGDAPADGHRFAEGPVRYTCWLYDPAAGHLDELFRATCDHAGCVAAGLAVAWHPDGERLLFVDRVSSTRHRAAAFDVTARRREDVSVPSAAHVAVGPRSALLGGPEDARGLWVWSAGEWWRVPDSAPDGETLASLRRQRPRWSRDGTKVAFVVGKSLRVCDTATRQTAEWYAAAGRGANPFLPNSQLGDWLHWHPDGTRVGLIDGAKLGLVGPAGWVKNLVDSPAAAFAGWDSTGRRTAYVTHDPLPYLADVKPVARPDADGPLALPQEWSCGLWAGLMVPNFPARCAVWFADADGGTPRRAVSGLRATFPHWSPNEAKLSVWLTVEPPYRLLPDGLLGMRPGDPAAVIDADGGRLEWLPVNGDEHAQIGHVELRRGNLGAAIQRFDEAAAALPPGAKADWMFFRAVALRKAGREADAAEAMRRFEPPLPGVRDGRDALAISFVQADPNMRPPPGGVVLPRHRFAAEAFVSLEMAADGIAHLRAELAVAKSDGERISASVALAQLLLLAERRAEFAAFVADDFLPLASRVGASAETVAGTVLPLDIAQFAAAIPEPLARRARERVKAWRGENAPTDEEAIARLGLLRASLMMPDLMRDAFGR